MSVANIRNSEKAIRAGWLIAGLIFFTTGTYVLCKSWSDRSVDLAISDHGVEAMANITRVELVDGAILTTPRLVIGLSWRDRAGHKRNVRAIPVSARFWHQLQSGAFLAVRYTPIKYLESDTDGHALLVQDADQRLQDDLIGICLGLCFIVLAALVFFRFEFLTGISLGLTDAERA